MSSALNVRRKMQAEGSTGNSPSARLELPAVYMHAALLSLFFGGSNLHLEDWDGLLTFGV